MTLLKLTWAQRGPTRPASPCLSPPHTHALPHTRPTHSLPCLTPIPPQKNNNKSFKLTFVQEQHARVGDEGHADVDALGLAAADVAVLRAADARVAAGGWVSGWVDGRVVEDFNRSPAM